MTIISYSGSDRAFSIPTNLDCPLPQPQNYIFNSPIDDYENSCLHVKYQSVDYRSEGQKIQFYANYTPYGSGYRNLKCDWRYHSYYVEYDWKTDYHVIEVGVFHGNGSWCYWWKKQAPFGSPATGGEIPNCMSYQELENWLSNNQFRASGSVGIYARTTQVSSISCANPVISPDLAAFIDSEFQTQHPLEPNASTCFFDTVAQLKLNTNSIANMSEIASLAQSLLSTGKAVKTAAKSVSKMTADAWLSYRYCYTTTKSDVEEMRRYSEQLNADSGILRAAFSTNGANGRLKISYCPYANKMVNTIYGALSALQRVGLDPSLYNMWDMVPFSFIADWFVPIGDNLERLANQKWAATMPYSTSCLCSLKGTVTVNGTKYDVYRRFEYEPSYAFTWLDSECKSTSTWSRRVLDVAALTR